MNTKILVSLIALLLISASGALYIVNNPSADEDSAPVVPITEVSTTTPHVEAPVGKLPAGSAPIANFTAFEGKTWVWQKTMMSDGAVITPKKAGVFTLTFSDTGTVAGKTDCNGFGGKYQIGTDGVLTFSPLASTLMFCEDSEESVFTGMISKVNRYTADANGNLVLLLSYDSGSVIFTTK